MSTGEKAHCIFFGGLLQEIRPSNKRLIDQFGRIMTTITTGRAKLMEAHFLKGEIRI